MISIDQKLDGQELPLANRIPDPQPNPEEMYVRQERLQILKQKLQSLPTAYRQAVWLCDVQEISTREAVKVLGLPVGTLKSQLHRARIRLGEEFAKPRSARRVLQPSRGDAAITRYQQTLEFAEQLKQPAA